MLIKFVCGNCTARLKIESTYAGEKIECPECELGVRVPSNEIAPGVVIGGFEIKKLIGKGGMGEVYLARQLTMDRDIALKILPAALTRDKSLVDRFLQEVRNSARLDHPNIVTAYEAGEDDGVYFMAMAFVKGETLDHILQHQGFMQEADALELVGTVAKALRAAWNDHQMIHRDIKPENIMIDHKGIPKVLDMGLSKSIHDQASLATSPDTIMGSPNFMSPEQTQDSTNVDFRTDMYSLGTSLYNMLTGEVPFHGNSYLETLKKQATGQLKDPRTYNPDISESCLFFMERLLAKAPGDRFDSWDALIDGLDQVIRKESFTEAGIPAGESMLNSSDLDTAKAFPHDSEINRIPAAKSTSGMGMRLFVALLAGGLITFFILSTTEKKIDEPGGTGPVVQPGIPNPSPVPKTPDAARAELARAYSKAVLFWQSNPTAYAEALSRFEAVGKRGANSEYFLKAADLIVEVNQQRKRHIEQIIGDLRTKGMALIAEGRIAEAVALLKSYHGPLVEETRSQRIQLITQVETLRRNQEQEQARKDRLARLRALKITNEVADHLLNGDLDKAQGILEKIKSGPNENVHQELMKTAKHLVDHYNQLPETIMNSYSLDLNNELRVELKRGIEQLQIKKANKNGSVSASRKIRNGEIVVGQTTVEFSYDDLSMREMITRLDKSGAEDREILKGLVYHQAGASSLARAQFEASTSTIGKLLKQRLDVRLGYAQDTPEIDTNSKRPNGFRPRPDRIEKRPPGRPGPRPGATPPIQANPGSPETD